MEEKRICEKILSWLPEKFEPIVAVLEATKYLSTMESQELWAQLKVYEERVPRHSEKSIESAFQSKMNLDTKNSAMKKNVYKGGSSSNFKGKGNWNKGGESSNNYQKSDSQQVSKCNFCKKNGHLEKNCWNKGKPQCRNCKKYGYSEEDCRYKGDEQADRAEEKEEKQNLFYACQSAVETSKSEVWFVDSGCTTHMSGEKSLFVDMDISVNCLVKMGDGNMVQANGRGTICVQTINGEKYIRDVLYVTDLEQNFLSVGQLVKLGYAVHFEDGYCTIYDKKHKNKR
ncbi:uncharacterized protein LOC113312607 [Papaver somniferum]|uniref:uncharacterized protein LOC113312607 n=1 Tax=Papaver somniferum TaxID=3469 RepID=UPI000E6FF308|nr:uncharacterized protein LOC113312607 [Papaver somniferum]